MSVKFFYPIKCVFKPKNKVKRARKLKDLHRSKNEEELAAIKRFLVEEGRTSAEILFMTYFMSVKAEFGKHLQNFITLADTVAIQGGSRVIDLVATDRKNEQINHILVE